MASGMAWRDEIEGGSFTKIADELDRIYANLNTNEFSALKPFLAQTDTTVPLGTWVDVPFNTAGFNATGGGTWTVAAANLVTYTYTLTGKTLSMVVYVSQAPLAGVVVALGVRLPAGLACAKSFRGVGEAIQGAAYSSIDILGGPGTTTLTLSLFTGGAYTVGNVSVAFTITFPVQ